MTRFDTQFSKSMKLTFGLIYHSFIGTSAQKLSGYRTEIKAYRRITFSFLLNSIDKQKSEFEKKRKLISPILRILGVRRISSSVFLSLIGARMTGGF